MIEDYEVMQVAANPAAAAQMLGSSERAMVDSQVATAKMYPRNTTRSIGKAIEMATRENVAQTCGYALPRGGKPIMGPSVHLAKLIVYNWGNMRTEAKVTQITDKQIIARGTCWDLENNVASAFEVRRSIVGSKGNRFSDDMITVTGNAACSIAYRNAVFAVIPRSVIDEVYQASQRAITGDLTNEELLVARRGRAIEHFRDEYGISEEEVIKLCGKQTVNQIRATEIALLANICQALRDGDTTVDDLTKPFRESKEAKQNAIRAAVAEADKQTKSE